MNNRKLEIAALFLVAWVILLYPRNEAGHRVVISGPEALHLGWDEDDGTLTVENEELDPEDVDESSRRARAVEIRRRAREERLRLRSEIREQWQQVRQEGRRARAEWREEYGRFRNERNRTREEIKRDLRAVFREFRGQIREFRSQARQLREEIRQHVRELVGAHPDRKSRVRMADDDTY